MDPRQFRSPESGRLVPLPGGAHAFVPAPLPPAIRYTPSLVMALSRADAALGRLAGLAERAPHPNVLNLLLAPFQKREAVLSSRIEGTRASLDDLLLEEAGEHAPTEVAGDVQEVRNYVAALEHGARRVAEGFGLSLDLLREVHALLMKDVRGGRSGPGRFRDAQNWIGPPGSTLATASFVPPPPREVLPLMTDLETFLGVRNEMPDLVQCAIAHVQFEAIHPFRDGNGRVGRLLVTLFLLDRGRLPQPLLYLSDFIERHRGDYYDLLRRVHTDGDWASWLAFFLAGVEETAAGAVRQASVLMDIREDYIRRMGGAARLLPLVDALFANPYVSINEARRVLGVSRVTARNDVLRLCSAGILRRVPESRWGRLYVAQALLDALENPTGPEYS